MVALFGFQWYSLFCTVIGPIFICVRRGAKLSYMPLWIYDPLHLGVKLEDVDGEKDIVVVIVISLCAMPFCLWMPRESDPREIALATHDDKPNISVACREDEKR